VQFQTGNKNTAENICSSTLRVEGDIYVHMTVFVMFPVDTIFVFSKKKKKKKKTDLQYSKHKHHVLTPFGTNIKS
jgi:hypothetical protein